MEPYLSEAGLQEMKEQTLDEFIDAICKEIRTKEIRKELPEEEKKR